ncbi:putative uncharacterized protein BRD3OS [Pseudoliparis swirei]|uniref:putative uncharacterized protein BRD3OS n=1 Tax=Pseudoliparis swirei TaxID=2059687 RepID=UPI0024BD83E4|nr:putative uncharacterized protein BRD3OS [Pseudoliparis swirei]
MQLWRRPAIGPNDAKDAYIDPTAFARLRYLDTSLLVWQQQQQDMQATAPPNYLSRSQSAWYSSFGNQAVLVRDKKGLEDADGRSRICSIM